MNQHQFDEDSDEYDGEYGYGWRNNPIRKLFDNPRQQSERSWMAKSDWKTFGARDWHEGQDVPRGHEEV